MQTITRDEVQAQKTEHGAVLVDVLNQDQYNDYHLPEAINIPLDDEFEQRIQQELPDKQKPVVVYCLDERCDASPKAAERMESVGYQFVYDYEQGKADWKQAGLPTEP